MTNQLEAQNFLLSQIFVKMIFYVWNFQTIQGFSFIVNFNLKFCMGFSQKILGLHPKFSLCNPSPPTHPTLLCYALFVSHESIHLTLISVLAQFIQVQTMLLKMQHKTMIACPRCASVILTNNKGLKSLIFCSIKYYAQPS